MIFVPVTMKTYSSKNISFVNYYHQVLFTEHRWYRDKIG